MKTNKMTQEARQLLVVAREYLNAGDALRNAPGEYADKELLDLAMYKKSVLRAIVDKMDSI